MSSGSESPAVVEVTIEHRRALHRSCHIVNTAPIVGATPFTGSSAVPASDTEPNAGIRPSSKRGVSRQPSRTSPRGCSRLYGGTVNEWETAPTAGCQYELVTETDELDVLIPPQRLTQDTTRLEYWTAGGRQRLCDTVTEELTNQPCICSREPGDQKCRPRTLLQFMLPRVPDVGVWVITSSGWAAAAELPGTVELLASLTERGVVPEAFLTFEVRTSVKDGQTHHFQVPVLRTTLAMLISSPARRCVLIRGDSTYWPPNPPGREAALPTSVAPVPGPGAGSRQPPHPLVVWGLWPCHPRSVLAH